MAIKIDNKEFLSYEEQVLENKKKILEIITEVNAKLVEIDDKVKDTLIVNADLAGVTNIDLSSVLPNQGELVVGDLVIGTDGLIARVLSVGVSTVDITPAVPVLDYMLALNVHFDGTNTNYLTAITDVQNALKELDIAATAINVNLGQHKANTGNPHSVTKAQVGLGNVDNTADTNKPISVAQGVAINSVSQNINTHKDNKSNPHQVTKAQVGLGNVDNTADMDKPLSTYQEGALNVVIANIDTHKANKNNPHEVTKAQVGLGNVDNTSDLNKPVSTAAQTELNKKADKVQESWITPTLVNSWANVGAGYVTCQYYKNSLGEVIIKGAVQGGSASQIMTLPVGYRPTRRLRYIIAKGTAPASVDITLNGDIIITTTLDSVADYHINVIFSTNQGGVS